MFDKLKLHTIIIAILLLQLGCHNNDVSKNPLLSNNNDSTNLYKKEYIFNYVINNQPRELVMDPKWFYTIGIGTDSTFGIIYKPIDVDDILKVPLSDRSSDKWLDVKKNLLAEIKSLDPNFEDLTRDDRPFPALIIKTHSFSVIDKLCQMRTVQEISVSEGLYFQKYGLSKYIEDVNLDK